MRAKAVRLIKWSAVLLGVVLLTVLVVRAVESQRGPPLELWHTYVPHELSAGEIVEVGLDEVPRRRAADPRRGSRRR